MTFQEALRVRPGTYIWWQHATYGPLKGLVLRKEQAGELITFHVHTTTAEAHDLFAKLPAFNVWRT